MKLRPGDRVRVRALGRKEWANAAVELASDTDPSSVMLRLLEGEGLRVGRGVYFNFVPLTLRYQEERVEGLLGGEYEIEVASQ